MRTLGKDREFGAVQVSGAGTLCPTAMEEELTAIECNRDLPTAIQEILMILTTNPIETGEVGTPIEGP